MKFLSIIIPCYNVAEQLPATIQSLRNLKESEDCEFIFINDGSTDETLSLIQDFAKNDKRAIIIDQQNSGVSAARNAALTIMKGQYVLPLDGDDSLTPDAISIIKSQIKEDDLLITPIQIISGRNTQAPPLPFKECLYNPYTLFQSCRFFPTAPQLVYKSSIINDHTLRFNEKIHSGEVYAFTCTFLKYCHNIVVSHQSFYQYVMRDTSATHAPNFQKDATVCDIVDYISENTDSSILEIPSYYVTLFKMCTSFTYNKYAKLGITDPSALDVVKRLLKQPSFHRCIKKVAFSHGVPCKERFLALYMLSTGAWGYKILASIYIKRAQ